MPALKTAIKSLYLEIVPADGIEDEVLRLPDGAYVGITCSPRKGIGATLELVDRLRGHDYHLVPHIAARQVRDAGHLREILAHLADQDIKTVFVPGGDIDPPAGQFDSAFQLRHKHSETSRSFQPIS